MDYRWVFTALFLTTASSLAIDVTNLTTNISNAECGKTQLCANNPDGCNPSTSTSRLCYFLSALNNSDLSYTFWLSGNSAGYIAATLATTVSLGNNEPTYICANNNSRVQFLSALLQSNGTLVKQPLNVSSVNGSVQGDKIQCTFTATVPASATNTTSLSMEVSTGTYNSANGDLGPAISQFRTNLLNLSNPHATVTYSDPNTQTIISNEQCNRTQLCAAMPKECDPSNRGSCYFLSAHNNNDLNYTFWLSGNSSGYIAATLATTVSPGNNESTYICANNNGTVEFLRALLQIDGTLVKQPLNVSSVKGSVNGTKIQCTFMATVPASATSASTTSLSLEVSTGTYNSTNGDLGPAKSQFRTNLLNLSDPHATVTYSDSNTQANEVTPLTETISNAECRKTQLCAANPKECNPSAPNSCYFLSAHNNNDLNYTFWLSGNSSGYIAATLATTASPGNNESAYVCANNNGKVRFFSALLQSDGTLMKQNLNVSSVKGSVNGTKIQCTFMAIVPTPAPKATAIPLSMGVSTGTYNSTTDDLGPAISQFRTALVNLSDPNATVTYSDSNTQANEVTPLTETISNAECRKTQLCAAKPKECDPSTSNSCYFLSAHNNNDLNYTFWLSGNSSGYIAATLATTVSPGDNEPTCVCANNNGKVRFFSALLQSNGTLMKQNLNVRSVKGSVNGDKIQCTFMATVPASATKATATSLSMGVSTGTYNSTTDDLGPAFFQFRTALVDLSDPNATVFPDSTNASTIRPPNYAIALQHSLMQALLITVSVLGLAIL